MLEIKDINSSTIFYAFEWNKIGMVTFKNYKLSSDSPNHSYGVPFLSLLDVVSNQTQHFYLNEFNVEFSLNNNNSIVSYNSKRIFVYTDYELFKQSLKMAYKFRIMFLEEEAEEFKNSFLQTIDKITETQNNMNNL